MQPPAEIPTDTAKKFKPSTFGKPQSGNLEEIRNLHWETVLSDHPGQIMNITTNYKMINWNIMAQGAENDKGVIINAYQKKEEIEVYKSRLTRIAKALAAEITKDESIAVTSLQEVPKDANLRNYFFQELAKVLPNWKIDSNFYQDTKNSGFGQLIMYDQRKLNQVEKIEAIAGLEQQEGRVLALDMKFKDTDDPIRVVNGHFRKMDKNNIESPLTPVQARDEINKILNSTEKQVVIAADFNQEIAQIESKYKYANEDSASYSFDGAQLKPNKIDGFIFKSAPESFQATLTSKFSSRITWGDLIAHFSRKEGYQVSKEENRILINFKNGDRQEKVIINRKSQDLLEFKSTHVSDKSLSTLAEAAQKCLPKGAEIIITVTGGTEEERKAAKNQLWLQAVNQGLTVKDYKPDDKFIEQHQKLSEEAQHKLASEEGSRQPKL